MAPVDTGFATVEKFSANFMAELLARSQEAARSPKVKQPYKPGPRPARAVERLMATIKSVIPEGFALGMAGWFRCVTRMVRESFMLNRNRAAGILAVARHIWNTRDRATATCSPGVATMAVHLGFSQSKVQRALRTLREWGVLATVAEGRSLECTEEKKSADRAVWALLLSESAVVEKSDTPEETLSPVNTPQPRNWAQHFARKACGAAEYQPLTRDQRNEPLWHGHATTSSLEDEGVATHELMRRLPALAKASVRELQQILSPLFQCGATIKHLIHMIDHRPDGSQCSHDGASGVRNVAGWLRGRLAPWADAQLPA